MSSLNIEDKEKKKNPARNKQKTHKKTEPRDLEGCKAGEISQIIHEFDGLPSLAFVAHVAI